MGKEGVKMIKPLRVLKLNEIKRAIISDEIKKIDLPHIKQVLDKYECSSVGETITIPPEEAARMKYTPMTDNKWFKNVVKALKVGQ